MIWRLAILSMIAVLTAGAVRAEGRTVVIFLRDSTQVTGELLAVRDTALIITSVAGATDELLKSNADLTVVIPLRRTQRIRSEGRSWFLPGLGIGFLGGGAVGAVIGLSSVDENNTVEVVTSPVAGATAALTGALVGGLVGGLIGLAASSRDIDYPGFPYSELRSYSRYKEGEPHFLRERR